MVECRNSELVFRFPDVSPHATFRINLQRTLRIPDDGRTYPLPPGLGTFPLRHVEDHAATVPPAWLRHGGVMMPMYQSEALWLHFITASVPERGGVAWPFAVRVSAGKIDAVTGRPWASGLAAEPQNYMVAPDQPWLDGFCVEKGMIRQFVAMPLGSGYSAEEQLTGRAEWGGLQIAVHPMKRAEFERRFPRVRARRAMTAESEDCLCAPSVACAVADMALAPGGRMKQDIAEDRFGLDVWEPASARCFVHLCNSLVWQAVTGQNPLHPPPTAAAYAEAGLPWFEHYTDRPAVPGSPILAQLRSVIELARAKGDVALPENESATPGPIVKLPAGGVRDGQW